ncbi:UNVERIFIED_ORG: O-antigen ligase [Paenarthrobacter nicotinovorans]
MNAFVPLVTAIFLLLPFSEALPPAISATWTLVVFGVLAACALFGKLRRPVGKWVWFAAAYLAVVGVISSLPNADDQRAHLIIGLQVVAFLSVGPYAIRYLASIEGLKSKAVTAFLAGQSISATAAIAQAGGYSALGKLVNGRAAGFAGHPNILGVLSGVAGIVLIHLLFTTSKRKLLLFLALVINLAALVASGSVSALIACGAGVLVYMVAARVSLRVPLLIVGGVVVVLWGLTQIDSTGVLRNPVERIAQVTGQTGAISTLDIRQYTYAFAWNGIQNDPFYGRGLDDHSGATFDMFTLTHNVLLRSWFQGGLAMGLAFAIIYLVLAGLILRAMKIGANSAPAGVLTVIIGFSLTSAALQQGYFWLLIFGALALIVPRPLKPASGGTYAEYNDSHRRPDPVNAS